MSLDRPKEGGARSEGSARWPYIGWQFVRLPAGAPSRGPAPVPATIGSLYAASHLSHDLTMSGRLCLAFVLGAAVGAERGYRAHPAGLRTFGLVGLGAAAFVAVGLDAFPGGGERVVQGVATGVGFLGAGLVVRAGQQVKNLTSAASIWAVAAVGVLAGAGRLVMAVVTTALVLFTLELPEIPGLRRLDRHDPSDGH